MGTIGAGVGAGVLLLAVALVVHYRRGRDDRRRKAAESRLTVAFENPTVSWDHHVFIAPAAARTNDSPAYPPPNPILQYTESGETKQNPMYEDGNLCCCFPYCQQLYI